MNSLNRSASLKEEDERFDELVLMNKNQAAGPPVLDGTGMVFPSPPLGLRHSPSIFPGPCPGLDEVTEPGLLSFLTGEIGSLPDQMAMPSFLGESFNHHRQLRQSPSKDESAQEANAIPNSSTLIGSSQGRVTKDIDGDARIQGNERDRRLLPAGADERNTESADMAVDRGLFDQVSDSMGAVQEFPQEHSSLERIAMHSTNLGDGKKKQSAPRETMKINVKGKGVQKVNGGSIGSGSAAARSSAASDTLKTSAKEESGTAQAKEDEKENIGGQQATRLRYSKGAAPSKYCHVCGRSAKTVSVALCGNNKLGLCRKVVCDKCLIMHQWGDFRNAKEAESSWTCTHCRGDCPPRARCHQYQRNNMRRRLKSSSNHPSVGSGGAAGAVGPRVGVSRSGVPLSGAAATSAAQHSARMSMRPLATLGPLPGVNVARISSGGSGANGTGAASCGGGESGAGVSGTLGAADVKDTAASDDLTPTNIIGAAGGIFQSQPSGQSGLSELGWLQGSAPVPGNFEGGNMYTGFNFLE